MNYKYNNKEINHIVQKENSTVSLKKVVIFRVSIV